MKRVGVIVGVDARTPPEVAKRMVTYLQEKFPGVTIAIVGGAVDSVAFEWDDSTNGNVA